MSGGWKLKVVVEIIIQTLLAFFGIWFIARLLGRKQIAQLTVYEYINGITFGSIAATLATDLNQRTWHHLIGLFLFGILTWCMSYLSIKSKELETIFQGEPIIVIQQGKILEENLKRCLYSINDLQEQLRIGNVFDIKDVKYAIVESNGNLSIMRYEDQEPVTLKDIGLMPDSREPFTAVILNGKLIHKNLKIMHIDEKWLKKQLNLKGISDFKDVMYAAVNKNKQIYIDVFKDNLSDNEKTPF
ncbi:MAG: hypothetical protein PWP07_1592 [Epulopiscium sp.]|jgi:uncharacterized membrane protein YcaP (DUF421 family)|nr:hypothetical protein [Candidatus Epulonipiscium sp.]